MVLDAATIRNLELTKNLRDGRVEGSLLDVIDFTVTPMGGRLLRNWLLRPLLDCAEIEPPPGRGRANCSGTPSPGRNSGDTLKGILDLERLTGKISLAAAHPRDLVALKKSLLPLPKTPVRSSRAFHRRRSWPRSAAAGTTPETSPA